MLRAILTAIRAAFNSLASVTWWMVCLPLRAVDGLLGGGGASDTVTPPPKIQLPETGDIEVAKFRAQADERMIDKVSMLSPSMQVQRYALASSEDRHSIDLSLLGIEQKNWLRNLPEPALKSISKVEPKKLERALNGVPFALPGIDSVGQDTRPAGVLAKRIATARSVRAEVDHILTA